MNKNPKQSAKQAKKKISKLPKLSPQVYLENIIADLPAHVYWKDRSGKILGCNKKLAQLLGYANITDVIGKNDYDFFTKKYADKIRKK